MALERRTATMPMAHGLQSKVDPRALPPPNLSIARDIQFDEEGGIQPRGSFADKPMSIVGGGTITDPRRVVAYGDELVLFTASRVYSWSDRDQGWVLKDTHMATVVAETPVFVRTEEQARSERAELGGVVVYAWVNIGAATQVRVAALDAETGAVLLSPKAMGASGSTRPRMVTLSTRILLLYESGGDLVANSIDPAALGASTGAGTTIAAAAVFNGNYDVCRSVQNPANALVAYRRDTTTSYSVVRVPEVVAGSTTTTIARTCDGPIAVSAAPSGDRMAVVRGDGAAVDGDLLVESTFADVSINLVVGAVTTPINISAAFRSVQDSGAFRCYAFWSQTEGTGAPFETRFNFMDTAGAVGASAVFCGSEAPVSRAFDHGGQVFVWLAFAQFGSADASGFRAQLQNTYFLRRDDRLLVAKAAMHRAGGHTAIAGQLATVQDLGNGRFAWCGEERRIIPLGGDHTGYSDRGPLDIAIEFDRDEARRAVRLGETLYIAGGQILQYDGEGLAEVGFHVYPCRLNGLSTGVGTVDVGTHALKQTFQWDNAKGERERSTTATVEVITSPGGQDIQVVMSFLWASLKQTGTLGNRAPASLGLWRTLTNPSLDAPFFLASSQDPADTAGDNCYIPNTPLTGGGVIAYVDSLTDADLAVREASDENDGVLEHIVPPGASVIAATQDRLFLAGIPNNPNLIAYSRLRGAAEIASFHEGNAIELPPEGGAVTALAFLNETLVAFCESAVFALPNDGFDNVGRGDNYGPGRIIASDIGAESQEAVAFTPMGLVFKSRKGWFVMADWGAPRYVGGAVAEFDDEPVQSIVVVESQHQVRILTDQRMLVWDYVVNQGRGEWAEWPIGTGLGATLWQGQHVVLAGGLVKVETSEAELVSRLAIGRTLLTSGSDTTDGATIVTASIAPLPFRPIFAAVQSAHGAAAVQPTASGCGLTWELVSSLPYNGGIRRVSVFKAMGGAPTPGALTFDFGGTVQTSFVWSVVQLDGASTDDTVLQVVTNTAVATTINATLAALEHPNNNMLVFVGNNQGGAVTVDPQFTELSDNQVANGSHVLEAEAAANQTTCDPTWGVSGAAGIIALEVKAGGIGQVMLDTESSWIRTADLEGFQRIWWLMLLGELVSACRIRVRLKRDYDESVYFDDMTHSPPGAIGGPLQVRHSPLIQQTEAIKVRITVVHATVDDAAPEGPGAKLTGLALEYGSYPGLFRGLPANQRQ